MTEEIHNDCRFCENGWCNIYLYTCDYDDYCSSNEECPIKEMIVKFKILEQERDEIQERILTLADTYQETRNVCKRLEQENKDFEILAKSLYKRIEELEKENEALAFRERLYKADYEASEQENKELKEENENYKLYGSSTIVAPVNHTNTEYNLLYGQSMLYKSALEEVRDIIRADCKGCTAECDCDNDCTRYKIKTKIDEVLQ